MGYTRDLTKQDIIRRILDVRGKYEGSSYFELGKNPLMKKRKDELRTMLAEELWGEFGDVPMNPETECIDSDWRGFPTGTHREDIWHWFEETFGVSVHKLMYGE